MALIALLIACWLAISAWRRRQALDPHWKPFAWTALGGGVLAVVLLLIDLESQKLAVRLLTPLGLVWLGLAAATLAALRRRAWRPGAILGAGWLLVTLGGNVWLGAWLLGRLEAAVPAPPPAVRWDAACVLGGGSELDPAGEPQLGLAGDRLRVGAVLWREHRVPLLVTSGSGMFGSDAGRSLAAETAAIWTSLGIPAEAIVQVPGPVNTAQEIAAVAKLARERGWQRVAIVTSAWHLRRALALAERAGLAADGVAADQHGRIPPLTPVFLVPCGLGANDVQLWMIEVIGRLVGR